MNLTPRSSRSGIALIMVLVVITVLGILAGGFAYSMKVETKLARNASFEPEFEWMGRSGVELARYVLAQSAIGLGAQCDALNQKWAGGPGDTNGPLADLNLDNYPLGNGTLSVKIVDMDRKFNINMADEMILKQGLTLVGVDAAAIPTIVDSILDWRDPDEDTHMSGTESDYYQTMDPPYFAKNGPIDDLTELLLVRGITPAMYWGSSAEGHSAVLNRPMNSRPASQSAFDEPTYAVGLVDLFTPLSSRRVNLNTASAKTLQLMPVIDENLAQAIIAARSGPDGAEGTEDDTPFRSPGELARVPGIPPMIVQQIAPYFGTRSLFFEARVDVQIGSLKRQYVALIRRNNPRDIQVMNMHWR